MKNLVMKMYYGWEAMIMILSTSLLILVVEKIIYYLNGITFSGRYLVISTIIVALVIILAFLMIIIEGEFSDKEILFTKCDEKNKKGYERYLLFSKVVYALAGLGLLALLYETKGGMLILYHACLFIAIFTFVMAIIRGSVLWHYCKTN